MAFVEISLRVEEMAFIPVMRVLNSFPGVADIRFDLDKLGPKRKPKTEANGAPALPVSRPEGGMLALIMAFLSKEGPQHVREIKKMLDRNGYQKSGVHSALNDLKKKGATESAGIGIHKLTAKAMAGMQPQEPRLALPAPEKIGPRREATPIILAALQASPSGSLTRPELTQAVEAHGFVGRTIDNIMYRLRTQGFLKPIDPNAKGVYQLTPKGRRLEFPPT